MSNRSVVPDSEMVHSSTTVRMPKSMHHQKKGDVEMRKGEPAIKNDSSKIDGGRKYQRLADVKEEEGIEPDQEVIEPREVRGEKRVSVRRTQGSKQTSGKVKRKAPDETVGAGVTGKRKRVAIDQGYVVMKSLLLANCVL